MSRKWERGWSKPARLLGKPLQTLTMGSRVLKESELSYERWKACETQTPDGTSGGARTLSERQVNRERNSRGA